MIPSHVIGGVSQERWTLTIKSSHRFQKKPQIQHFEFLDDQDWIFCFHHFPQSIQRRKITKMIDHQCYIVIYFYDPSHHACIIWWDQLSVSQWKNLKILAKLA